MPVSMPLKNSRKFPTLDLLASINPPRTTAYQFATKIRDSLIERYVSAQAFGDLDRYGVGDEIGSVGTPIQNISG